ncbi:putative membrane protein [Cedratvirus kamchatka]|uniref:Membrane protein n=1 Tax=Cedratvirus kamchatka TaxID=2716914 RepID=A0A6G8MX62_9VIRU|nr:putative membrane protein [Cedratvirus kamchatka]
MQSPRVISPQAIASYVARRPASQAENIWKTNVQEVFPEQARKKPRDQTWEEYFRTLYKFKRDCLYLVLEISSPLLYGTVLVNNRNLTRRSRYPYEVDLKTPPLVSEAGTAYLPVKRTSSDATQNSFYDFVRFWAEERAILLREAFSGTSEENFSIGVGPAEREFLRQYGFNPRYLILSEKITPSNVDILPPESEPALKMAPQSPIVMEAESYALSPPPSPRRVSPSPSRRSRRSIASSPSPVRVISYSPSSSEYDADDNTYTEDESEE